MLSVLLGWTASRESSSAYGSHRRLVHRDHTAPTSAIRPLSSTTGTRLSRSSSQLADAVPKDPRSLRFCLPLLPISKVPLVALVAACSCTGKNLSCYETDAAGSSSFQNQQSLMQERPTHTYHEGPRPRPTARAKTRRTWRTQPACASRKRPKSPFWQSLVSSFDCTIRNKHSQFPIEQAGHRGTGTAPGPATGATTRLRWSGCAVTGATGAAVGRRAQGRRRRKSCGWVSGRAAGGASAKRDG